MTVCGSNWITDSSFIYVSYADSTVNESQLINLICFYRFLFLIISIASGSTLATSFVRTLYYTVGTKVNKIKENFLEGSAMKSIFWPICYMRTQHFFLFLFVPNVVRYIGPRMSSHKLTEKLREKSMCVCVCVCVCQLNNDDKLKEVSIKVFSGKKNEKQK